MPKIIVIDDGHSENGLPDPGASGNGLVEAILTGQIGDVVRQQLSGYDADVRLAPRGTLSERAAFANKIGADLLVSIHINAGGGQGYESHVHPGASEATLAIATSIHTTMAAFYSERGFRDRGLKRSNFAVLRETHMPAVLLENLFIDSVVDAEFLKLNVHAIGNEIAYAIVVAMRLKVRKVAPADPDAVRIVVAGQVLVGKLIDGRTYAPVRALAEALGKTVGWDEATGTVTVK